MAARPAHRRRSRSSSRVVLGLGYPLVMTGIGQALFGDEADGSLVEVDGKVVGSKLIGQDFSGEPVLLPEPPLGDRLHRRRHLLQQPRPEQPQARPEADRARSTPT